MNVHECLVRHDDVNKEKPKDTSVFFCSSEVLILFHFNLIYVSEPSGPTYVVRKRKYLSCVGGVGKGGEVTRPG